MAVSSKTFLPILALAALLAGSASAQYAQYAPLGSYGGNYGQLYGNVPTIGGYNTITTGRRLFSANSKPLFSSNVNTGAGDESADAMTREDQKLFLGGAEQGKEGVAQGVPRETRTFGASRTLLQSYGSPGTGYGYGYLGGYYR